MSRKTRKVSNFTVALVGLLCSITSTAYATPLTVGFTGDYDVSNWVKSGRKTVTFGEPVFGDDNSEEWLKGEPGEVDISGVPEKIAIRAASHRPDALGIPSVRSLFTSTTTAVTNGEVSFDRDHLVSGETPLVAFGFFLNKFFLDCRPGYVGRAACITQGMCTK